MENGLANLVNKLPHDQFAHFVICLTYATDFRHRIQRDDVTIVELYKPAGKHPALYLELYKELKRIQPDIVHTRNLGTLDLMWPAFAAGCPVRIHGEHGWDAADPSGSSRKYKLLRRICDPVVHRYVAVSKDIHYWLKNVIGIPDRKIVQIHNGVDIDRFTREGVRLELPFPDGEKLVFGTVGRQDAIKGLDVFLEAIKLIMDKRPALRHSVGVILAGDGPEHEKYRAQVKDYGLADNVYLPGKVEDVASLLRSFDFFVQPSVNEGISNTILEAMSTSLPVIATNVGGNPELVRPGYDGFLVDSGNVEGLADCIERYIDDSELRRRHGETGRRFVEESFSLRAMTEAYATLYANMAKHMPRTVAT